MKVVPSCARFEGYRLEFANHGGAGSLPEIVHPTCVLVGPRSRIEHAPFLERTFDRANDVEKIDLRWLPGEAVLSAVSTLRDDEPLGRQRVQDLGEEWLRYPHGG